MCDGCQTEFEIALEYQQEGAYFATSIDRDFVMPCWCKKGEKCSRGKGEHFSIWMVDDEGKWVVK
jgi:hypothetical protein